MSSSGKHGKQGGRRGSSPIQIPERSASDISASSYVRERPEGKDLSSKNLFQDPGFVQKRVSFSRQRGNEGSTRHDKYNPPTFPPSKPHLQRTHSNSKSEASEPSPLLFRLEELDQSRPNPVRARPDRTSSFDAYIRDPYVEDNSPFSLALNMPLPPTPASSYPGKPPLPYALIPLKPVNASPSPENTPTEFYDGHDYDEEFGGKKRKYHVW